MAEVVIVAGIVGFVMVLVGRAAYRFVSGKRKGGCPGGCHSPCCRVDTAHDPVRGCGDISCLRVVKHSDVNEIPAGT